MAKMNKGIGRAIFQLLQIELLLNLGSLTDKLTFILPTK